MVSLVHNHLNGRIMFSLPQSEPVRVNRERLLHRLGGGFVQVEELTRSKNNDTTPALRPIGCPEVGVATVMSPKAFWTP